ncbi:phage protease [uncultured Shewanella sp.]|uniref:phage protease n=1 Tax=uncultured Shewanella sp. TaxID=173975 RepID=UPI0026397507|nr:phage protease [uncultured Shewanella sp.]
MFQLAALTSSLTFALKPTDDGYIQALPDGYFNAVDGRPRDVASGKWLMDATAFAAMQANTPHQAGDLVIDYEHQTLHIEKNGQPAPAAGFFNIKDIQYREGQGLFIKPDFNDKAQAHLTAREYKYFSLVFGYDTDTGRPQYIHSGALTNRPGVDGMLPLASLSAEIIADIGAHMSSTSNTQSNTESNNPPQKGDIPVNETLKKLLMKLGIDIGDPNAALTDEQATAALSALDSLVTQAAELEPLKTQVAALTAQTQAAQNQAAQAQTSGAQTVDLTQYVPIATFNALREKLVSLSAENGQLTIEQAVKDALDAGKVLACEEDYLLAMGKQQGMAALSAHLDSRQPIAALTTKQTTTVTPPALSSGDMQGAALSSEELQMADAWGMSHDEFKAAKKDDK